MFVAKILCFKKVLNKKFFFLIFSQVSASSINVHGIITHAKIMLAISNRHQIGI